MKLVLVPIGDPLTWYDGSDTLEIVDSGSGLRVVLAAPRGIDRFAEIHFPFARAFQVLDEGDMLKYWEESGSLGCHAVFQVTSGGWLERASSNYFDITSGLENMREWLIAPDVGRCVTVISAYTPHIREFG